MQFGLFYEAPEEPGQTHAERYAEMLDLIAFGETLGFDAVWLAEIHFGGAFSLLSAPLMLIPVIAQRTRHIRIGTAVTQVPLHHPLLLAEQAALMMPLYVGSTSAAARDAMRPGVEMFYRRVVTLLSYLPESYGDHLPRLRALQRFADEVMPKV